MKPALLERVKRFQTIIHVILMNTNGVPSSSPGLARRRSAYPGNKFYSPNSEGVAPAPPLTPSSIHIQSAGHALIPLLVAILLLCALSTFVAASAGDEAQKSAEQWLTLVDTGKYAASWETAAGYFKTAVSREQWETSLNAIRKPMGDLVSRKLNNVKHLKSLPGAPDGDYVVIQFDTTFTNKKTAVETVTPMLDKNGAWRISGYYIK